MGEILGNVGDMIEWIDQVLVEACDLAAERIGARKPRRIAYWWQDSAATARRECLRARRLWQSAKRKQKCQEEIIRLGRAYKDSRKIDSRKNLRKVINKLKSKAWQELIDSIDNDPWGLPYRIVLKKLKSLSMTEKMDEETLERLLCALFPSNPRSSRFVDWSNFVWLEEWEVDIGEVHRVIRKVSSSPSKAPGPDGIRRSVLKSVSNEFLEWIRHTYNLCLKSGEFPEVWKRANLVLIPKAGSQQAGGIPKVRPICLLNEIAKAFKRIIADRIYSWQADHPESAFSNNQFGFRKRRSTCDAIGQLRDITTRAIGDGEFAIVVGLDIQNAFNSVPWRVIQKALRAKEFPAYLRRIIDSYLSDRSIQFIDRGGNLRVKAMEAGVPQGSVLGPILWNIAFDGVLGLADNDEHSHILCYADDTLIIVTGRDAEHTFLRAGVFTTRVVNYIQTLGLRVAENKTEAILFTPRGAGEVPAGITVGESVVRFQSSIKYLGVQIDSGWTFSDHFRLIERKVETVLRALNRLMPNLRGPDERRRRLYGNVVLSIILYGAPIWGDAVKNSRVLGNLVSLQRSLAQRIISSYRTVSGDAACLLARLPPIRFIAPMRKRIYDNLKEHQINGTLDKRVKTEIKNKAIMAMYAEWSRYLESPNSPGEFTKLFLVPRLEAWMTRKYGSSMTFHVTQVLTGHGCFSKFLYRIGRRESTLCQLCGEEVDDVLHTLRECPVWDLERIQMREAVGLNRWFSLGEVVDSILETREKWDSFCWVCGKRNEGQRG